MWLEVKKATSKIQFLEKKKQTVGLFSRNNRDLSSNAGHGFGHDFEGSAPLPLMQLWRQLMSEQSFKGKELRCGVRGNLLYDTFLKEKTYVQIASAGKP